jgi:hypothetical protein
MCLTLHDAVDPRDVFRLATALTHQIDPTG